MISSPYYAYCGRRAHTSDVYYRPTCWACFTGFPVENFKNLEKNKPMANLATAIALASKVFEHKIDKAGKPYILHCIRVMNNVGTDEERQTIAILHDVVEDTQKDETPITLETLKKMGFSIRVVVAVGLLTHDKSVPYMDYIKRIATNEDARAVKLADLRDNSDITRLKGLRKKDFDRMEKYHAAYLYLS